MIKIDTLEIQRRIEEIRQVFGKKLEVFLLSKSSVFLKKIDRILGSKNFIFWSVSIISLLSIFLRSRMDIGSDSGLYLDIAEKIANGGRYYYDFFERNSPLSFFIHLIPYYLSKFTGLNPIITADYFINFLGIASIAFSASILNGSNLNRTHKNLIISSFAVGFFLRIGTLEYGEFLTRTSFYLTLALPYISYSFARKSPLNNIEMLWRGISAGLIPCINLHYIMLPLIIELNRFWKRRSASFFGELDKLVMVLVGCSYLVFMIQFTPEFFEYMVPMWSNVDPTSQIDVIFGNIATQIFSKIFLLGIFLVFLKRRFSAEDKILFLVGLSATASLIVEGMTNSSDQEVSFFVLVTPIIVKIFYDFVKSRNVDFTKDKLLLGTLLVISLIDKNLNIVRSLMFFWMIIIPIVSFFLYRKLQEDFPESVRGQFKILLTALVVYVLLLYIGVILMQQGQVYFILLSVLVVLSFLFLYEKLYQAFYQGFSSFFVFVQFCFAASLLSFYIYAIAGSYQGNHFLKSPNFLTDNVVEYVNSEAANKDDQIFIFSYSTRDRFPLMSFLGRQSEETARTYFLFDAIGRENSESISNKKSELVEKYILRNLKNKLIDENTKILFINSRPSAFSKKDRCTIGFLEFYFRDLEFKKIFLKNFEYSGRIFLSKDRKDIPKIEFLETEKDIFDDIPLSRQEIRYDFDVYTRK